MEERDHYELATATAELMYVFLEFEYQQGERDPDAMMRRLKDLSAYSLTHAEIMDQREGPEMLALAMFFGATSEPRFHKNQERIGLLSQETIAYQGHAKIIEEQVAQRKANVAGRKQNSDQTPSQLRMI